LWVIKRVLESQGRRPSFGDPRSVRVGALKAPLVVRRDAELRALVPGNSSRHLAHTRGARQLIGRSDPAKDRELVGFWTVSEEVTDVPAPI
jgi:hypothetical protein